MIEKSILLQKRTYKLSQKQFSLINQQAYFQKSDYEFLDSFFNSNHFFLFRKLNLLYLQTKKMYKQQSLNTKNLTIYNMKFRRLYVQQYCGFLLFRQKKIMICSFLLLFIG
ncbi:hypothetical protein IMG5_051450 [Ichthyophthirius multifiliis]|uniref:Uncharacterized protein n=1 Tax=Ichthyophthirius multifiliis TaxID=5932 RepID=G0QMR4_ICHMU|nr:hypothetical protein IMG5_051450 [Ichthyophthirius multifiliis]EGR33467.1 hypothetical protein IMG5_051450 [Ichthyophthirius multifiliis]|eukprot:XP_004037453.1 hypothetical protein IMG5_051450 [Ichthyophthirius multifiliis]